MNTRDTYPDASIPGWLRDIRDGKADKMTVTAAAVYGAEKRTREIARERLAAMENAR